MCEPVYSENNLNFRLVFLQKLDTVNKGIYFVRTGFERLYMPLGPTRGKSCPRNDTFSDPRLQRSKHGNNSDRSLEQQDMQALG